MLPRGTYLLIGSGIEPQVHMLGFGADQALGDALRVAAKYQSDRGRRDAYRQAFGVPADYAVPAWSRDAMVALATQYTGEHQARVRGLAACIATGQPFGPDAPGKGKDEPKGGRKARLSPEKPIKPRPGGAAAALMFGQPAAVQP